MNHKNGYLKCKEYIEYRLFFLASMLIALAASEFAHSSDILSTGQTKSAAVDNLSQNANRSKPRMLFADTISGKPYCKDPAVVKFGGRYWLYYSLPPYEGKPTRGWSIGIASSENLGRLEKSWRA